MAIIKSAKKRIKQSRKRQIRNYPIRSNMKTHIKKVLIAIKEGDKAEAEKQMKVAYSLIDTAAKKNIIHKNNAANKKSRLARALAHIGEAKPKVEKKTEKAKKTAKKPAASKKEEKK